MAIKQLKSQNYELIRSVSIYSQVSFVHHVNAALNIERDEIQEVKGKEGRIENYNKRRMNEND
jgi:hypothetical protein